jgi:DNA polymerase-4
MSVLCVQIPGFLLQIAYQAAPDLQARPVALLDAQGRVCAANQHARLEGVTLQMRPQQALACCPDLALPVADLDQTLALQGELLATLTALGLPTEEHGWGRAYLDLHAAAHTPGQVQETASALGQSLRQMLGDSLVPALGWDSSKFTARAAATYTVPGHMKLVSKADQPRFLAPLPTRLLPLSAFSLQELSWLGIQTLGQFARQPAPAVVQRYGPAGRTAHQWARGLDDRPVRPNVTVPADALTCSFDPPVTTLEPVLAALRAKLQPPVAALRQMLCGVRRLLVTLSFCGGDSRALSLLFVEPVGELGRILQHVADRLQTLHWPQALERLAVKLLESGELVVEQRTLFEQPPLATLAPPELAARFGPRYGTIFWQSHIIDPTHPLMERRFMLHPMV